RSALTWACGPGGGTGPGLAEPGAELLAVGGLPDRAPAVAGGGRGGPLGGDPTAGDPGRGRPGGAGGLTQPALADDRVLVVAEDALDVGHGVGEGLGRLAEHRLDPPAGVAGPPCPAPALVGLLVGRVVARLANLLAQLLPWLADQRRHHLGGRAVGPGQQGRRGRGG